MGYNFYLQSNSHALVPQHTIFSSFRPSIYFYLIVTIKITFYVLLYPIGTYSIVPRTITAILLAVHIYLFLFSQHLHKNSLEQVGNHNVI